MLSAGGACCSMTMIITMMSTSTRSLSASLPKCRRRRRTQRTVEMNTRLSYSSPSPSPPLALVFLPPGKISCGRDRRGRSVGRLGLRNGESNSGGGGGFPCSNRRRANIVRFPVFDNDFKNEIRDALRTFSLPGKWETQSYSHFSDCSFEYS